MTKAELGGLINQYFSEVQHAKVMPGFAPGGDPAMSAAIDRFALAYYRATVGASGPTASFTAMDPLEHLFRTAADFVTPGDLLRTASLVTAGEVK